MEHSTITVIIAGNTYRLTAFDNESILAMPNDDRQALLALLESVKEQEALKHRKSKVAPIDPKDMGKGDLDAMAAQLIMKEKSNQKPSMTKRDLYKWIGGFTVVVILLILLF